MEQHFRTYGDIPYEIAVLHGGPGAPGDAAPLARELSKSYSVIEPFQTGGTIQDQIIELHKLLIEKAFNPIILIGHSWGAWLAYIFAATYPQMVKKLIMISSGPLEEKYVTDIASIRFSRLSVEEKIEATRLENNLTEKDVKDRDKIFARLGELMTKADSYEEIKHENDVLEFQAELFQKIWTEAMEFRRSGKLLKMARTIRCPVTAIHGIYDSHPAEGVKIPLSRVLKDFKFILIKKCGHYPWYERFGKEEFYIILFQELEG